MRKKRATPQRLEPVTKRHAKTTNERRRRRAAALRRYALTPKGKFSQHKKNAKFRGIEFTITYGEWLEVWADSGHYDERHNKTAEGFVMARNGDRGAYAVGNVSIIPHRVNVAERNRNFFYAKRYGIPWDWFLNRPPTPKDEPLDTEIPF